VTDREGSILERVLQQVDHPGLEDPGLDLRGEERRRWREYEELAGLLPQALDPVAPGPELLPRLLHAVRREGAPPQAATPAGGERRGETPALAVPERRAASQRALAAALGALVLGLGLVAGWLGVESARLRRIVTGLEHRLEEDALRERELRDAEAELARLRGVFTAAGMQACPLRPWGGHPAQPAARAVVYFDRDRHQWYLTARDLEPCHQGARYVLWFMVDGKPVPGGSFRPERGEPVALGAPQMPEPTSGAFVTLEPDPRVEAPTGQPILYGEDPEQML
jgi:hypothetical protein